MSEFTFYTPFSEPRPIRLSEETRRFAWESLHHKYGLDAMVMPDVPMDDIPDFDKLEPIEQYDLAIRRIATDCRLRICEGEKLSGAATMGGAIGHVVPAVYKGEHPIGGISHLTVNFEVVLHRGFHAIREDVLAKDAVCTDPIKKRFYRSCLSTIESLSLWRDRYLELLQEKPAYRANYEALLQVPFAPARNFYEAVQSLWFTFAFLRNTGNWPGIGRIDWLLGDYLKKDLASGVLSPEEAREIMAHFFIKGCEWIRGGNYGTGDAQHYQNLVLAGVDDKGDEITNEVTYLVLDIIEETGIGDFPTTIRLNRHTEEKLLRRSAEVVRYGGGVLAFYNEDLILESLRQYGYPEEKIRRFANDGCWEVQLPGETNFLYSPFDSLQILQKKTLSSYENPRNFASFEELYSAYRENLREDVEAILQSQRGYFSDVEKGIFKPATPCTAVSLLEDGCIEKGLSYAEGGPHYFVRSLHIGGLPDTVNSLYAIKKLVFDEKKCSFEHFMGILKNNWEGEEALRRYVLTSYAYYGNDNPECDDLSRRILHDFALMCRDGLGRTVILTPPGVSTFGRQADWRPYRLASPHGHKIGEILAPNLSPTPGTDREGATAILKSYAAANLQEMTTGAALDLRLTPSALMGEDGIVAFIGLLKGFLALGGYFVQPDVQDATILEEAQAHPEEYQTLSVRVSGWNARFVTLCKEWQDMIIDENRH